MDRDDENQVVIVGAGVAGLAAADTLTAAGTRVQLVDKADRPGGRLAVRVSPHATFAVGPVRASVDDREVRGLLAGWSATGVDGEVALGAPRSVVAEAIGTHQLVQGLGTALRVTASGVEVVLDGGSRCLAGAAVIVTPPVPQVVALLERSGLPVPATLTGVAYAPRWVLAAELAEAVDLAAVLPSDIIAALYAGDGSTGTVATAVVHATSSWSACHLDADATQVQAALLEELHRVLPAARVVWSTLKRWRYATVTRPAADVTSLQVPGSAVWVAGDGFGRPGPPERGVADAVRSGIDAARAVQVHLS